MFRITDTTIECTRGDCCAFTVSAVDPLGERHCFQPGDVIRFMIFAKKNCANVVLKKDFSVTESTEAVVISLSGRDTKFGGIISKPVDFWYSVELNPDTVQQTLIGHDADGAKIFTLYPEGKDEEAEL